MQSTSQWFEKWYRIIERKNSLENEGNKKPSRKRKYRSAYQRKFRLRRTNGKT